MKAQASQVRSLLGPPFFRQAGGAADRAGLEHRRRAHPPFVSSNLTPAANTTGEVPERPKGAAWKADGCRNAAPGFESLSLRHFGRMPELVYWHCLESRWLRKRRASSNLASSTTSTLNASRLWPSGRAAAFQAAHAGSTPAGRSTHSLPLHGGLGRRTEFKTRRRKACQFDPGCRDQLHQEDGVSSFSVQ